MQMSQAPSPAPMQSGAEAANAMNKKKNSNPVEEVKSAEVKDSASRKQMTDHNFIGVPPNMTESSAHSG